MARKSALFFRTRARAMAELFARHHRKRAASRWKTPDITEFCSPSPTSRQAWKNAARGPFPADRPGGREKRMRMRIAARDPRPLDGARRDGAAALESPGPISATNVFPTLSPSRSARPPSRACFDTSLAPNAEAAPPQRRLQARIARPARPGGRGDPTLADRRFRPAIRRPPAHRNLSRGPRYTRTEGLVDPPAGGAEPDCASAIVEQPLYQRGGSWSGSGRKLIKYGFPKSQRLRDRLGHQDPFTCCRD